MHCVHLRFVLARDGYREVDRYFRRLGEIQVSRVPASMAFMVHLVVNPGGH